MNEIISGLGLIAGSLVLIGGCIIAVACSIAYAYEMRRDYLYSRKQVPSPNVMAEIHQMHRWLAEFPIADAITTRLINTASEDGCVTDISAFRERLRNMNKGGEV